MLDIHQIVTGRGNAEFMMFPDGTTLLLDAGDSGGTDADQRPDTSRTPSQWIARYIRHMAGSGARLDYAVRTAHDDRSAGGKQDSVHAGA